MSDLVCFLSQASGSPSQVTSACVSLLEKAEFERLFEDKPWNLTPGKNYFFTRNMTSVFAFSIGEQYNFGNGFAIVGAHCDSPGLQLKPHSMRTAADNLMLSCEVYGGGIWHTWFDRDLGVSGKVLIKNKDGTVSARVVTVKKPLFFIPSLAIHLTPGRYAEHKVDPEKHLHAIVSTQCNEKRTNGTHPIVLEAIANELKVELDQIVGCELRLCDAQPPSLIGLKKDLITGQGIDNINGTYCSLQALINASTDLKNEPNVRLLTIFDHEEVGSSSFLGADSVILQHLVKRIVTAIKIHEKKEDTFVCSGQGVDVTLRKSFVISVDNAHACHPNYADRHEEGHRPTLNGGPVVKQNVCQRYATEVEGKYLIYEIAKKCDVPLQEFVVRQDLPCGSTIGPSTAKNSGIRTIDIGNPQLGMHSIREVCGASDVDYMVKLLTTFFKEYAKTPMPEYK